MAKSQKKFLYDLLNRADLLAILDYNYSEWDEESFKEERGVNFDQAKKAHLELLRLLSK